MLTLTAIGLAACNGVNLFGDGTSSSSSGPPTCVDGPMCCSAAVTESEDSGAGEIPSRPTGAPAAGNGHVVLAISRMYFGDTDRSGNASTTAWTQYGLNIDGKNTQVGSTDTCSAVAGSACNELQDGDNGIDNSFGNNLMPMLETLVGNFSQNANAAIQQGDATMLVDLGGGGSGPSYAPMSASLYRAVPASSVLWNGTDVRDVDPVSLVGGAIASPTAVFPDGYMSQRIWVGTPAAAQAWLDLHVSVRGYPMPPLPLEHVQIVMQVAPDGSSATSGTLAGIIRVSDAMAWANLLAWAFTKDDCHGPTPQSIQPQVAMAADIMADGTNEPGQTCDAISLGVGFDAVAVQLGQPKAPPATFQPCDGTAPEAGADDAGAD